MLSAKRLISSVFLSAGILFFGNHALYSEDSDSSQSDYPVPIINIPKPYADRMVDMLDSAGFRRGLVNYKGIQNYNKIVVYAGWSKTQIKNSGMDEFTTERLASSKAEDDQYVLNYVKEQLGDAFSGSSRFKMVSAPGPKTLAVVFLITQVIPGDAVTGTLSNIPSPTWIITKPLSMGAHAASESSGGAISIEIIVKDSQTGRIMAVFASREKGANAVINTKGFTAYGNVRQIIDVWAKNLVSTLDKINAGQRDFQADYKLDSVSFIN